MKQIIFCLYSLLLIFPLLAQKENEEENCIVLHLADALSRALNDNRQLATHADQLTRSRYSLELANGFFDLDISPTTRIGYVGGGDLGTGLSVGGGIEVNKNFTNGTRFTVSPLIFKTRDHYRSDVKVLLTQPLLRGLGSEYQLSSVKGALFSLRSAQRNLYNAQVQLIHRTITALYEVVKSQKNLEISRLSYERIQQYNQASKIKEQIGLTDALDIYRADLELRQAEETLTTAKERLQESEDVVRELLALPLNGCIQVDIPLIHTPISLTLEEAIELALENRIEMDQAKDQWQENIRLSRIAKKNLYPELNLVLNYSNCGQDEIFTRSCWGHRESTWGMGFTTSTSFNAESERIAYEQSLLSIQAASRGMDQTRSNLILDVKRVLRQLHRVEKKIDLQQRQIQTAQNGLHLAKIKFDRGMVNNIDVLQAEKALYQAEQAYWSALVEHIVGEFQLLAAIGLLTDKPIK